MDADHCRTRAACVNPELHPVCFEQQLWANAQSHSRAASDGTMPRPGGPNRSLGEASGQQFEQLPKSGHQRDAYTNQLPCLDR